MSAGYRPPSETSRFTPSWLALSHALNFAASALCVDCDVTEVAEQALMLMLAAQRKLLQQSAILRASAAQGRWVFEGINPVYRLEGKTVGIVGLGRIGGTVYRLLEGFGVRRLVCDPYLSAERRALYGVVPISLPELLPQADVITIHTPLTDETRHLFDESLLREMKPTSFLVNVGRGELINENDLVKALNKGWIAGAGLDVFETEPLPENSPLWQMEKVIMTPHISGITAHYDDRAADLFATNLRRYLAGEPLLNLVKRSEGY